jgi:hypothetical protein
MNALYKYNCGVSEYSQYPVLRVLRYSTNFLELSTEHTLPPTRLPIPLACKQLPYLYVQSSSWRWTHVFETCRRHRKSYNISLTKVHFVGLYCTIILQWTVQKKIKKRKIIYKCTKKIYIYTVGKVNMELHPHATITVFLISKISSTCYGQTFAHLQERKT